MESRGMVLYMNRNTRKTTGHFILVLPQKIKKEEFIIKKKYPVQLKNKIEPTKPIADETLKMKLKLSVFLSIWEF